MSRGATVSSAKGAPPPTDPDDLASVGFLKDLQVVSLRRRAPLRRGGQPMKLVSNHLCSVYEGGAYGDSLHGKV